MLKIGDFSRLSRISIRMLRYYDDMSLLVPKCIDDFTGYRYYNEDQLPDAERITSLKDMGFSLSVVSEIIKQYDNPDALEKFLAVRHTEALAEAYNIKQRLRLLETTIERLRKDENYMNYNVTLKTIPERYVFSVRKIIPAYDQEGILWQTVMEETAPLNIQPAEHCYTLAIYHDMGYRESDCDVEIQGTVKGSYKDTEHVKFKTVPAVEVASATYKGSYDKIDAVNQAVANWVKDNGYDYDGPAFSIYHVSKAMTQNPDELVTEVCYPIKKK